jgi:hypothetical protein
MTETAVKNVRRQAIKSCANDYDFDLLNAEEQNLLAQRVEIQRTKSGEARAVLIDSIDDQIKLVRESRSCVVRSMQS